jgi:hypothetical protein
MCAKEYSTSQVMHCSYLSVVKPLENIRDIAGHFKNITLFISIVGRNTGGVLRGIERLTN